MIWPEFTSIYLSLLLARAASTVTSLRQSYVEQRELLLKEELNLRIGSDLMLSAKEQLVNGLLMAFKRERIRESHATSKPFPPSIHFFHSKQTIDNTPEYDVIRMMPKGANLHLHTSATTSVDWVVKNLTYQPDLYSHKDPVTGRRIFQYFSSPPGQEWVNVVQERGESFDVKEFDNTLAKEFSMWVPDPEETYLTADDAWNGFRQAARSVRQLTSPIKHYLNYLVQAMKEFLLDGAIYMEIRATWASKPGHADDILDRFIPILERFRQENPNFLGVKFIMSATRSASRETVLACIKETMRVMKKYPDLIVGFDLIGRESTGHENAFYLKEILYPQSVGFRMPFIFHAGETDWTEMKDVNLLDAVLLNATRIGHGYASIRHPKVMESIKNGQVVIELNPISNQVLQLVKDLRNHPGAVLFACKARAVIASDDPSRWLASPLSHDFYMAFMGLGAVHDDLRLLKQLAINSIRYSILTPEERQRAMAIWETMWGEFIDNVIIKYNLA